MESDNIVVWILACIATCILDIIDALMQYFNTYAYASKCLLLPQIAEVVTSTLIARSPSTAKRTARLLVTHGTWYTRMESRPS